MMLFTVFPNLLRLVGSSQSLSRRSVDPLKVPIVSQPEGDLSDGERYLPANAWFFAAFAPMSAYRYGTTVEIRLPTLVSARSHVVHVRLQITAPAIVERYPYRPTDQRSHTHTRCQYTTEFAAPVHKRLDTS